MKVRILNQFILFRRRGLRLGRVARPDDGGKDHFIDAVRRRQQFGVAKFDLDLIARHEVSETHRKHVRPVLLQERRALSFLLGLVEFLFRLFPL